MAAQTPASTSHPTAAATARPIALVADTHTVLEGPGIPVRRVLPSRAAPYAMVDPWLLLDEGQLELSGDEDFGAHPHRGFEIVSYVLEGSMFHKDDQGHSGLVGAGGLHRITAGRGMWHGEGLGEGSDRSEPVRMHVLQLWINLPRALKQIPADHQPVQAGELPEKTAGDARVKVLVGDGSPTRLQTPALYLDATLPADGATDLAVPAGFHGFAYVLDGSGSFGANTREVRAQQFAVLGQAPGAASGQTSLPVRAGAGGLRFVLAAARPIGEAPRWNGPFVD
jgi:redox-sensitive bicupin YhaK (pirin superfamily)